MKKQNCLNCGAPYDINENKCPFCGTSYFDLSSIDFDEAKPMFLKIKVNGMVITQKVLPRLGNINMSSDYCDITGRDGLVVKRIRTSVNCTTDVSFDAVAFNDNIFTITKE